MNEHGKLNYVEFPAKDIDATKAFFMAVFDWSFTNYGPDYTSFKDQGLHGGFYRSDLKSLTENGAALLVFYSKNLEQTLDRLQRPAALLLNKFLVSRVADDSISLNQVAVSLRSGRK